MFSKRGQLELSCTPIGKDVGDFLAREDNIVLDIVQYPSTGMDWKGFPNILFTTNGPLD